MKIIISKFAGFCHGVEMAYQTVIDCAKQNNGDIYILGDLCHNHEIVKKIESLGIKRIDSINDIQKGTIIITAHGITREIMLKAKSKKLKIIDTTCPKVKKLQQIVHKFYKQGKQIIIFGDKNHKEIKGVNSWCDYQAVIISKIKDLQNIDFAKFRNALFVSQTTQNQKNFMEAAAILRKKIKSLKIFNTICQTTKNRQEDIKNLTEKNDAIIVIGDKHSANSMRLFQISKQKNKNSFFINSAKKLDLKKFAKFNTVGVSAGASAPKWLINKICDKLKTAFG
ncbi:4-hydroxy-3-methylbut-2-enyl diphosphate reductase [Candidatus Parcubacteria bacterium]|nr:4-hydroxy-3-methylbut-2-enyl diphosphate reductase [Candidatus Parcubacteria bacterium]